MACRVDLVKVDEENIRGAVAEGCDCSELHCVTVATDANVERVALDDVRQQRLPLTDSASRPPRELRATQERAAAALYAAHRGVVINAPVHVSFKTSEYGAPPRAAGCGRGELRRGEIDAAQRIDPRRRCLGKRVVPRAVEAEYEYATLSLSSHRRTLQDFRLASIRRAPRGPSVCF